MKTKQYKPGQLINTKEGLFRVMEGKTRDCELKYNHDTCLPICPKLPSGCILKKVTPNNGRNNARIREM